MSYTLKFSSENISGEKTVEAKDDFDAVVKAVDIVRQRLHRGISGKHTIQLQTVVDPLSIEQYI
jgi:hypothetical protein